MLLLLEALTSSPSIARTLFVGGDGYCECDDEPPRSLG